MFRVPHPLSRSSRLLRSSCTDIILLAPCCLRHDTVRDSRLSEKILIPHLFKGTCSRNRHKLFLELYLLINIKTRLTKSFHSVGVVELARFYGIKFLSRDESFAVTTLRSVEVSIEKSDRMIQENYKERLL